MLSELHESSVRYYVWVANRETPISDRFISELKIVNGNLVLLNGYKVPIWSTNTTSLNSVIAVLLDDGNLVLRDGSKSVEPVWQSFDHPVHTWLPGAKLAYDHRTKKSQLLTSWRSNEDPGVGLFSFELVPSSKEYISKWNGSKQYWTSGPWNGQIFSLIPEMRLNNINYIYNFSFFANENESYFTYSVYNSSIIPGFAMDVSGQVKQLTKQLNLFWAQPRTQCEVYARCGAFGTCRRTLLPFCNCLTGFKPKSEKDWNQSDFSRGCVRKTVFECGNNKQISFLTVKVASVPLNSMSVVVGSGGECRINCLNNCRCNAYSFSNNKCSVWDVELLDLSEENVIGEQSTSRRAFCPGSNFVYNLHKQEYIGWENDNGGIFDFGLAKLVGRDFSRVLTTFRGTRGYLAPEWLTGMPVNAKADVFSYGMMLFELVHGKRNLEQSHEGYNFTFFPSLAANVVMGGGNILSLLDGRLNREASIEEVTKICKVAYWCIQDEEDSRPSMSQVERILEGVVDVSIPPIPRTVNFFVDDEDDVSFFNVSS
ncbi:hypothetical protein L1987_72687 [Smallanthus sonchifolius]|uniref:Uncharacterized protein n=1 Tax=Smallanthus sonchifolius TaxID=185202 RepID=A0ACB9AV36_9ASTR|nr:hypothetical protein L1987_72687 [Smallanthus sonchifolius]